MTEETEVTIEEELGTDINIQIVAGSADAALKEYKKLKKEILEGIKNGD